MTDTTWRGVPLAEAGDGILSSLALLANNLNVGIPVASVAAARTLLTQAEADGVAPTSSNPALFMVGEGVKRVLYTSDGTKSDGAWTLSPVNEVAAKRDTGTNGQVYTLSSGDKKQLIASTLDVAPYDREVLVIAAVYGQVTSGALDVWAQINSSFQYARLPSGNAASATAVNIGTVKAGAAPGIYAGVAGAAGAGGTIDLSGSSAWNTLAVLAFPITMA